MPLQFLQRVGALCVACSSVLALVAGGAFAHTVTAPPPAGPINTYYAENGPFGVFCAQTYADVSHPSAWQGVAITGAKHSASGLCANDLVVDPYHLNATAYLTRSDGSLCNSKSLWNTSAASSVWTVVTGCGPPATGRMFTTATSQSLLYSWDNGGLVTDLH